MTTPKRPRTAEAMASSPSTVVEVTDELAGRVAVVVAAAADAAIADRGAFSIAIAGGSLVKMLGGMASLPGVQWDKWHVAWVDERCVPHDHAESNYGGALAAWLSKVPIPKEQVYAIDASLCPGGGGEKVAVAAAEEYEARLRAIPADKLPRRGDMLAFDLLLLGFGPDGHICSLFPGHKLLDDTSGKCVLPIWDSPKPPPERISLSMGVVKAASEVVLVGSGDGKKEVVRDALSPGCPLPCARAFSARGVAKWLLDGPAAALLGDARGSFELRRFPRSIVEVCQQPATRVAEVVAEAASAAIRRRGAFAIAIAGGSLVKMLGGMASLPHVDWSKWHVAWVDERCVPHDHADSNYGGALEAWLSKVPIPKSQVHAIDSALCPGGGGEAVAVAAAEEYQKRLTALPVEQLPKASDGTLLFDLLLLGFGPDGHICSLFPDHKLLADTSGKSVLPIWDSPKPPAERITLSMGVVRAAHQTILVGTGDGKKEVVQQAISSSSCALPCARAFSAAGEALWILDGPAAALVPKECGRAGSCEVRHID
eukprot:TRINITY_DN32410_c0_g1_i1.p1 TRINITY_DN32410_c0_g1~~TRINITY_DN32410_c0_g1_i1.p1  ORF type:complete len:553 (-),score=91.88 TRINITY_DN32410_c0_g1_i1:76-1698(-)